MDHLANIWLFRTEHFTITVDAYVEPDLDINFGDEEMEYETYQKLNSGFLVAFCVGAKIYANGVKIGEDYLGNCIYQNYKSFRDHIGRNMNGHQYGSYFSDMVRECISQAREFKFPKLRDKHEQKANQT